MYKLNGQVYLSSLETANRIGLAPATLRTYRSDRRAHVPWIKLGGTILYRESDVDAYLARHRYGQRVGA